MEIEEPKPIQDEKELQELYSDIEDRCLKLDNYEEPGMTVEQMIEKLMIVLQSVKDQQLFSSNEILKEVHTENLKYFFCYLDFLCCLIDLDGFTAGFRKIE